MNELKKQARVLLLLAIAYDAKTADDHRIIIISSIHKDSKIQRLSLSNWTAFIIDPP